METTSSSRIRRVILPQRNHQNGLHLETQFSRDLETARFELGAAGSQSTALPQSYRALVLLRGHNIWNETEHECDIFEVYIRNNPQLKMYLFLNVNLRMNGTHNTLCNRACLSLGITT